MNAIVTTLPALPAPVAQPKPRLLYGAHDRLLGLDELHQVPTPEPQGRFHQPIPFGDYVELVKNRLDRQGIDVLGEQYCLDPAGTTFFGAMLIQVKGFEREGTNITLGVRGSHVQKVPRGLTVGTRVTVCSNLCFSGNLGTFSTKQTLYVWNRLPGLVEQSVQRLPGMAEREAKRHDAYRLTHITPRQGDAALAELYRRGALAGNQLPRAIREWDNPTYEEHAEDGHTAWRLLNAVTEVQKPTTERPVNMNLLSRRTANAVSFLDEVAGL